MTVEHEFLFSLGIDNGLRTIDMRRLKTDVGNRLVQAGAATILGKGRNGGKPGHLELNKATFQPLMQYLKHRRQLGDKYGYDLESLLVMEDRRYGHHRLIPMNYKYIREKVEELSQRSGIEFHAHDLRRSYGHRLHMKKVPLETIAKLMRHENPNQAFRSYIGIDHEELRSAQDLLYDEGHAEVVPSEAIQQKLER